MFKKITLIIVTAGLLSVAGQHFGLSTARAATTINQAEGNEDNSDYHLAPPFLTAAAPPLVMLVMGRSHKLYYEAYNDASDLDGDGDLDVGYKPDEIDYYGYFDSYKCYEYNSNKFEPTSLSVSNAAATNSKACSGNNEWSGDFLNYLTMSRMDALRKVLYGGFRSYDVHNNETQLKRAYIPQDAHSWGKEYLSPAYDGYDIAEYSPLVEPCGGGRHLFASTTLSDNGTPILRVAPNNTTHRIWEWVSKERPVADTSIEHSASSESNLHPANHSEFDDLVAAWATECNKEGSKSIDKIDGSGNDWGDDTNFLTIFEGTLYAPSSHTYTFSVDGSDAVEVIIDGTVVAGWYGQHNKCDCNTYRGDIYLTKGDHTIEFRHESGNPTNKVYKLKWKDPEDEFEDWKVVESKFFSGLTKTIYNFERPACSITDYTVELVVCKESVGLESNCKLYTGQDGKFGTGQDVYKPIGLLQRYGETEQMLFGLISGSYAKNTSGGVLRKKISLIADEIDPKTGEFEYLDDSNVDGIIKTIDNLRIKNYDYSSYSYDPGWPDAWVTTRATTEGEFTDWGNPTAEMMYEALRYFSGAGSAKSDFAYSGSTDDSDLGLPVDSWDNPYAASDRWCSQPFMLVISDINPSYDSDQLPGSPFSGWAAENLGVSGTLDVETLLDTISTHEGISGNYYIGDQGGTFDSTCTPKNITSMKDLRGLCPEEPTKEGSYYSASVAYYGYQEDMSSEEGEQKVLTFSVGLASPLPRIEIPIGDPVQYITLVPHAKSVGGCLDIYPDNAFTPTNTIVDFYIETITDTYGKFRINYEDVEQAADHDMDAIVEYEYQLYKADGVTPATGPADAAKVKITLTSTYASGCIVQHLGYIISGTTKDGTYLEVVDYDDYGTGDDVDYFADTPPGQDPGGTWEDGVDLPLSTSRFFEPGTTASADILENPLWYAAKWGSFRDHNGNDLPDLQAEWDENGDGTPDDYFYVQNPLFLEKQLNQAFLAILERATAGTSASVLSASRSGEGATYQSIFFPKYKNVGWVGDVHALLVDAYGQIREDTNLNNALDNDLDKIIEFDSINPGKVKKWTDTDGDGELTQAERTAQGTPADVAMETIEYLWSASNWLNSLTDTQAVSQKASYASTDKKRYIFTLIDADDDMVADSGEVVPFDTANRDSIKPYLHLAEPFTTSLNGSEVNTLSDAQIEFIRGKDQSGLRNREYDSDGDSIKDSTYRLGDIISSTATMVGTPAENYDLLYTDESYREFWLRYRNRRKVVYVGANDGMLHAFNAGFFYFDPNIGTYGVWKFDTQSDGGSETAYDLGAELWAYVPMNLLPHLYWLTDPNYEHVYYVDQKPKVFDAKIFTDDGANGTHPGGWGTVLVGGMRFGGGKIRTDKDHDGTFENGDQIMKSSYFVLDVTDPESAPVLLAEITFDDLGFTSSYPGAIVVKKKTGTDPNDWYLVLGSGPNGARLKYSKKNKNLSAGDSLIGVNSGGRAEFVSINTSDKIVTVKNVVGWFENGEIIYHDSDGDGKYKSNKDPGITVDLLNSVSDLKDGLSSQQARIYMVDLKELVSNNVLKDPNGSDLAGGSPAGPFEDGATFDANTQIADFITVDLDLDYATDAMYFGTVADTDTGQAGKLRRIVLTDPENSIFATSPGSWVTDSVLIDVGQPITTAPSIAMDWKKRTWVFFGTGRFSHVADIADSSQQSFYGIKEPWQDTSGHENNMVNINEDTDGDTDLDNEMTWEEVYLTYLMDVSDTVVFESGNIKNYDGVTFTTVTDLNGNPMDTFLALEQEMDEDPSPSDNDPAGVTIYPNGWKLDFSEPRERNLGQGALLGDVLTFTTYAPDPNACQTEGDSYLYATYYKTGTAFTTPVIGYGTESDPGDGTKKDLLRKKSLGKGLAVSPAMHTGREKGSKAFVQTSTGAILVIEQTNPGAVKSGRTFWMEED